MFCPNNSSLKLWDDKGFPVCFYNIVSSAIPFGFIFLFGSIQIWFYGKYAHNIEQEFKHKSFLFIVQIFLALSMIMESFVRFAFETTTINKNQFYGSLILNCAFSSLMWIISLILLFIERRKALPSVPSRGHGLILLVFWTTAFVIENMAFVSFKSNEWFWKLKNDADYKRFSLWLFRYVCVFFIFVIGLRAPGVPRQRYRLLIHPNQNARRTELTWKGFFKKIRLIGSYLWPKNDLLLQANAIFCILLLVSLRATGLLLPIYSKKIINELSAIPGSHNETVQNFVLLYSDVSLWPWDLICILIGIRFLQGSGAFGSGFIGNLRSTLWVKVEQYTARNISSKLFSHLHSLSLKWHLTRKTGEVLRIVSRGTDSVNNLTEYLLFNIVPTFVDIIIAIVYFVIAFNMWFGIIVFTSVAFYLGFTILITEWRAKFRRDMIELDNLVNAKAVDSLLNFETVKYFNAEKYELEKYQEAFIKYQKVEWVSSWSLWLLNFAQNVVISIGLLVGSLYCAWLVSAHEGLTVGDYVLFSTYVVQLYAPLNWLGTYYRMIQQAFVDMESMFELFDQEQDIKDAPNAVPIQFTRGLIEFDNVVFNYSNERPCLKGISFRVLPGQTVAIVGPSGAGKSTIVRLVFRFYDINSGSIKIDGQDIRLVTQESLRKLLGVVPQDTVLFNNDIKYNIRYGRVNATDEEVQNAAVASDLHNAILTFEKGYDTVVGERGLKLSGGEKQRVAIARTILKSPQIVLLDEATSALDTKTERNIQSSLQKVCENRTTIVIAHRLSTIVNADQILVLKDGEIVERGSHAELLSINEGVYASMWNQQQQAMSDVENKPDVTTLTASDTAFE